MFPTLFGITFCFILISVIFTKDVAESELKVDNRIVNGHPIDISRAPYQAVLLIPIKPDSKIRSCGGAIISTEWLLTAARCTTGVTDVKLIQIRVGVNNFKDQGIKHKPVKIIRHDKFVPNIDLWDIVLYKVSPEFRFSETVNSIPLASNNPSDDSTALSYGYGSNKKGGFNLDLQEVEIYLINRELCNKYYTVNITDQHICGGGGGKGLCFGDEGSPLVSTVDKTLIGIGLFFDETNCTNSPRPGVYSSVPYFRDWIKEVSGI